MNDTVLPEDWFVTDWFIDEKPSRPGVYQVRHQNLPEDEIWWSKWNGNSWFAIARAFDEASQAVVRTSYNTSVLSWRGVIQPHQCKLCGNGKFEHHRIGLRCPAGTSFHMLSRYTPVN